MKVPLKLLQKHLELNTDSIQEIAATLDRIGIEVEKLVNYKALYHGFITALIQEAVPHPNAKNLQICTVYNGKEILRVVCGAQNARAGIKVVLATEGAVVPKSGLKIEAATIRGVASQGMLCSAEELCLSLIQHEGILELPAETAVGVDFAASAGLDDIIFDLALTPNRRLDCASVYGIARDLAAAGLGVLKTLDQLEAVHAPNDLNISIGEGLCYEFFACIISGIKQNPDVEIESFLSSIGKLHELPLVNTSQFAMLEYGRPSHFYDADKIVGQVEVRQSHKDEAFTAIGGLEYKLPEGLIVVADSVKILSVAGVIGGESSKVEVNTTKILVEVAAFNKDLITKAGVSLGLLTDARFRFEAGVDLGITEWFCKHIVQRITSNHQGKVISQQRISKGNVLITQVEFDYTKAISIIGCNIPQNVISATLAKLGFEVAQHNSGVVSIPTWRQGDVTTQEDLIEEVLRILSIDSIPSVALPLSKVISSASGIAKMRAMLTAIGLDEIITYPFISHKSLEKLRQSYETISIENPIQSDRALMRPTLIITLLEALQQYLSFSDYSVRLFELGKIYKSATEIQCIAGLRSGFTTKHNIFNRQKEVSFFDARDDLMACLGSMSLSSDHLEYELSRDVPGYYHPGSSAKISYDNKVLGYCGEIHPDVLEAFEIPEIPVVIFELFLDGLPTSFVSKRQAFLTTDDFCKRFPIVERDFSFVVPNEQPIGTILLEIEKITTSAVHLKAEAFDVYQGEHIDLGKKSVGIKTQITPLYNTLTDSEIKSIAERILEVIANFGGAIRI